MSNLGSSAFFFQHYAYFTIKRTKLFTTHLSHNIFLGSLASLYRCPFPNYFINLLAIFDVSLRKL